MCLQCNQEGFEDPPTLKGMSETKALDLKDRSKYAPTTLSLRPDENMAILDLGNNE
jgi:hypothetical protein